MSVSLPEDEYLALIGQFAYMVAGVEGLLLFDLPRHARVLPPALTVHKLAGLTTVRMAQEFQKHARGITDAPLRAYYTEGGARLEVLGAKRNAVLHARPATINGEQRLDRWKPSTSAGKGESHPIDIAWLEEAIDLASEYRRALSKLRPPNP